MNIVNEDCDLGLIGLGFDVFLLKVWRVIIVIVCDVLKWWREFGVMEFAIEGLDIALLK